MDDLSFEDFETEYKYLKAIEGGLEIKPDNAYIRDIQPQAPYYTATGPTWKWIRTYTVRYHEEKLSLVERFGITIFYNSPSRNEYLEIVKQLALRYGIANFSEEELCDMAIKWELSHGGLSGRTAQQFIYYLAGKM